MAYFTYLYRDPSKDNEPFYVGSRKGAEGQTPTAAKQQRVVQQRIDEIRRKGFEPSVESYKAETKEKAKSVKYQWVKLFGCLDLNTGTLLNSSKHAKISKESSEAKAFSPSARANMSAAAKKRILTPEGRVNLFTSKIKDEHPPQLIANLLRTKSQQLA